MRLAAYSVEWEAHPNSMIDSWIRGFVDKWTRGLVDSWIVVFVNSWIVDSWIRGVVIRGFVDRQVCGPVGSWISWIRDCLKITQISVSLLNRPQSHWNDEIENQSATWKVRLVNGKLSQSILQFWTSATHSTCPRPCAKCGTCKWQINSIGRVFHLELISGYHLQAWILTDASHYRSCSTLCMVCKMQ